MLLALSVFVRRGGFEPPKPRGQRVYSASVLTTYLPTQNVRMPIARAVRTVCNIFAHATIRIMFGETARVWAIVIFLTFIPAVSFAAAGLPDKIVPCDGVGSNPCTFCHLVQLAQNLLNSAVFLAVFMSALLFAYAGWQYLTNEALHGQAEARGLFRDVVIGLIIILAAWLVVDTIMKTLTGGQYLPWNSVCSGSGAAAP